MILSIVGNSKTKLWQNQRLITPAGSAGWHGSTAKRGRPN